MLKTELLEIIANGENSGVEFKRDDIRPEQLAREVVAMLNFRGARSCWAWKTTARFPASSAKRSKSG